MEAIGKTWEKFLTIEGDALKSGGTDEFLSRKKNGLGARNYGEGGAKAHRRIYKMTPP